MSLSESDWLQAVAEAARAPSPHNAQPARWRLVGDRIELFGDPACWLAAGDASGRDDLVALGMAWEAMALALSQKGFSLNSPALDLNSSPPTIREVRRIAAASVLPAAAADPLAAWQAARRSYRGAFPPADHDIIARLDGCIAAHGDIATPIQEELRGKVARWYDAAAADGLRNPAVAQELYDWMRLSRSHPSRERDGLAADCLELGAFEAWGASWLMRPVVLSLLGRIGLLWIVVSERAKVLSAARLVAIHADVEESFFSCGRRWYRFWLALAAAGFCAVPMSALVDSAVHADALLAEQRLAPGRKLVNVLRVGSLPARPPPRSARRPVGEFVIR